MFKQYWIDIRARAAALFRRKEIYRRADEELQFHLEMMEQRMIESGVSPDDARVRARRQLGNTTSIKEQTLDAWRYAFVDTLIQDFRFALRTLRKNPGFGATAVLTLALGIGAATAVFSIVDAVLLRPLPYKDSDRLVAIWGHGKLDPNLPKVFLSYADFDEFRRKATAVEEVAAAAWGPMESHILSGAGTARQLTVIPVTASFFSLLGARADVGRTFSENDEAQGCSIVLANSLWRDAFAGDPAVVGKSISLDQSSCSVVGIMPAGFAFYPSRAQGWLLIRPDLPRQAGVGVFARLAPRATLATAQSELQRLYAASNPDAARFEPQVFDLHSEFTFLASRTLRTTLLVALSAVGLLLLIACLNVGNLLLARMTDRQREMALRSALGSGQVRLARQTLTESLLLAFFGTISGIGLASAALRYFQRLSPIELTVGANIEIHGRVLAFAILLMVGTTLGFGFWPALSAAKVNLADRLKTGGRGIAGGRVARATVAVQMGMSFVLLAAAMLLLQSTLNMGAEKLGFALEDRASAHFTLPRTRYADNSLRVAFFERLEREVAGIAGVRDSALASRVPPSAGGFQQRIEIQGQTTALDSMPINVGADAVNSRFFGLLDVPLVKGRLFDSRDRAASEAAAIVNEKFVSEYFPASDPIGHHVRLVSGTTATSPWLTIVGVVGNLKQTALMNEMRWTVAPHLYRPTEQDPQASMNLLVRFKTSSLPLAEALKGVTASLEPEVPFDNLQPIELQVSGILAYSRFRAVVLVFFALSALLLSAIGLHGVLNQLLRKRTAEFAIRRAVGAPTIHILNLILRQAGLPVLGGLLLGLILTFGLSRVIASLLYESASIQTIVLIADVGALLLASALAIARPAIAASRVDPGVVLRSE
jgi:putative ABC transport system permease protein